MKKKIIAILGAVAVTCFGAALIAGCSDGGNGGNPDPDKYEITVESGEGCTAKADKEEAEFGDTVTITVEVTDPDMYIEGVFANEYEISGSDGKYTTQITEDTTFTVEMAEYKEVLEDHALTYSGTKFAITNSKYPYAFASDPDIWELEVAVRSAYDFRSISRNSYVESSNQNAIPDEAILDYDTVTNSDIVGSSGSNQIVFINIPIDTTKINAGTTWLTIYLDADAGSSSAYGTLVIPITVYEEGEMEIATEQKSVIIDVSTLNVEEGTSFTMHFYDNDFIDGGTAIQYFDVTAKVVDDTVTFVFDYAIGHHYGIAMSEGETYDYKNQLTISQTTGSGIITGEGAIYDGYNSSYGLMFNKKDSIELEIVTKD